MRQSQHKNSLLLKLGVILITSALLSACASTSLQAPCDQYASFCGSKTKINHW